MVMFWTRQFHCILFDRI